MKNGFVKGAVVLVIFNLIGKVLGAIYRIPLANLLGLEGMGEYQLIFPLYSLLLAVSTSGIPVAMSKLVAEYNSQNRKKDSRRLLWSAVFYLAIISFICSAIVVFGAKLIAGLQGNKGIYFCYYGIAPAIFFVGLLSAFRGYFQGNLVMMPTAISGLVEQSSKLFFGLFFASRLLKYGVSFGVLGALIGISISELFALIFIFLYYIFLRKKNNIKTEQGVSTYSTLSKQLLSMALPITFGGLAYPIVSIIDSVLVVNLLMNIGYSSTVATAMYGIEFGVVDPLINIPIIIAVAVSSSILPNISKVSAIGDKQEQKRLVEKALQITLSVSLACAICYVVFGKQILSFLYGGTLTTETLKMATILLFLGCINLIFMSLVQVSSGILQGLGKHKNAASAIGFGALIKVVLTIVLVGNPRVNIYGVMISGGVSYLAVFVANYLRIKKETSLKLQNIYFGVSIQECAVCLVAFFSNYFLGLVFGGNIALFGGGFIAVMIFAVSYYILFVLKSKGEDYST